MAIEAVHIVLCLVDTRISGIQRKSFVVIALIILEVWQERQIPSVTGFVRIKRLVPRIILRVYFRVSLKVSWSASLRMLGTNWFKFRICGIKFSGLEALRFVHVYPDSIIWELILQILEALKPHVGAVGVEPVDEHSDLRPHLADQIVAVSLVLIES